MASRIVVTEQIYHQVEGRGLESKALAPQHARSLSSDEQSYVRSLLATEGDWVPLDHGWVADASLLVVENARPDYKVIPTKEQRVLDYRRTLLLSFDGETPHIRVSPGESCRIDPVDLESIWVRCAMGETRYTVTVVPS